MECLCHITGTKTFHDGICKNFAIILCEEGGVSEIRVLR